MTENPNPLDTVTDATATDPLSAVTRGERKALLAACAVGLAISVGGLVPQKIEALGIAVSASQKENLLQILAGVIAFFVAGFVIYAWADLKRRETIAAQARGRVRPVMDEAMKQYRSAEEQWKGSEAKDSSALFQDERFLRLAALSEQAKLAQKVSRVATIRVIFDVHLPIAIGFGTILTILATTHNTIIARFIEVVLGAGLPVIALVMLWRSRQKIVKSVKVRIRHYRDKRFNKMMQAFNALPEGDPRKEVLQGKAKKHIDRKIEDLKNGIY